MPSPDVPDWLVWVWRAWWRLHEDRPWLGGGLGPLAPCRIPWRDVVLWAGVFGLDAEQLATLERLIGQMDAEFLAWHVEKNPPPTTKGRG